MSVSILPMIDLNEMMSIHNERKSFEAYLYSLFGANYIENIVQIVNMIHNPSSKFTLHIWYNKSNGSSGKNTLMNYLKNIYENTFYEIPISYMRNIELFISNIDNIQNQGQ